MDIIRNTDITTALQDNKRVYLCGNLTKPNGLEHIHTTNYEIGISDYPEYTFEHPHYHATNHEYNYVLSGSIKILLLNTKQEYEFTTGDLFVIAPNEPYVAKCLSSSRTIFSKVPGGNDKVLVELDDEIQHWGSSWEATLSAHNNI
jgi:quercetin dioxygenase-like cupin family protein